MKIIFVRHGKDDDRYRGGWSDLDLIPEGEEQAKRLAKYLKENEDVFHVSSIISSDLRRALTTATYIGDELKISIRKDSELREMNNGDLAGMLNETALEKYPGLFFSALRMDEAYPNGESPNDFYCRIKKWLKDFLVRCQVNDVGNVLVVTHGGVISLIYHLVENITWSNQSKVFKASNCSIHILNTETLQFEVKNKTDFLL